MTTTSRVVPRSRAEQDIDEAVDHYFAEGGAQVTLRFINSLESAFKHLAATPDAGSPRYATELDLPGLRHWRLNKFPYLIFYVVNAEVVDVWRVLHGKQDIPLTMQTDLPTE